MALLNRMLGRSTSKSSPDDLEQYPCPENERMNIERRISLFKESSMFVESKAELTPAWVVEKDHAPLEPNSSKSPVALPQRGKVSISTVFVSIFLIFVTILDHSVNQIFFRLKRVADPKQ